MEILSDTESHQFHYLQLEALQSCLAVLDSVFI